MPAAVRVAAAIACAGVRPAATMCSSSMCSVHPNMPPALAPPTSVPSASGTPAGEPLKLFTRDLDRRRRSARHRLFELRDHIGRHALPNRGLVQPRGRGVVGGEARAKERQREEDLRSRFEQREQLLVDGTIAHDVQETVDARPEQILGVRERGDVGEHAKVVRVRFADDRAIQHGAQLRDCPVSIVDPDLDEVRPVRG